MKRIENEEVRTIKQFCITLIIVIIIAVGIYFFTRAFVTKDLFKEDSETNENTESVIDDTKAIVGTMLKKNNDDYYVIVYDSSSDEAAEYLRMVSDYKEVSGSKDVITVDLSNPLNSKYYDSENTMCNTNDINEMKFGNISVLRVKDNKVNKCLETTSSIKKEWKIS